MEYTILFFATLAFALGRATKKQRIEYVDRVEYVEVPARTAADEPDHGTVWSSDDPHEEWEEEESWEEESWNEPEFKPVPVLISEPDPVPVPVPEPEPLPVAVMAADPLDVGMALLLPVEEEDERVDPQTLTDSGLGWRRFLSFENIIFLLGALTTIGGALYTAASSWSSAADAARYGMVEGLLSLVGGICAFFGWRLGRVDETKPAAKALSATVAVLAALTAAASAAAFGVSTTYALAGVAASSLLAFIAAAGLGIPQGWRFPASLLSLGALGALSGAHPLLLVCVAVLGVVALLPGKDSDDTTVVSRALLLALFMGSLALVVWRLDLPVATMAPAMALLAWASPRWSQRFVVAPITLVVLVGASVAMCGLDQLALGLTTLLIGFFGLWRGLVDVDAETGESKLREPLGIGVVVAGAAIAVFWAPAMGLLLPSGWTNAVVGTLQGGAAALASAWDGLAILAVTTIAMLAAATSFRERQHERFTAHAIALATLGLALLTVIASVTVQPLASAAVLWLCVGLIWRLGRTLAPPLTQVAVGLAIVACGLTAYAVGWQQWYLAPFFAAVVASFGKAVETRLLGVAFVLLSLVAALSIGTLPSVWPTIIAITFTGLLAAGTRVMPTHGLVLPSAVGTVLIAALTTTLWGPAGAPIEALPLLSSVPLLLVAAFTAATGKLGEFERTNGPLSTLGVAAGVVLAFAQPDSFDVGLAVAGALSSAIALILGLRNGQVWGQRADATVDVDSIAFAEIAVTALLAIPTLALPDDQHWLGVAIVALSGFWLGRKTHVNDRIAAIAQPLGWWLLLTSAGWAGWLTGGISGVLMGGTGLTLLTSFAAPVSKLARRHANEASVVATVLFALGTVVVLLPDIGQFLPVTVTAALVAGIGVLFATGPGLLKGDSDMKRGRHLAVAALLGLPAMGLPGPLEWIGPGLLAVSASWLFIKRDTVIAHYDARRTLPWFTLAGAVAWSGWLLFGAAGPLTALAGLLVVTACGTVRWGLVRTNKIPVLWTHLAVYALALGAIVEPTLVPFFAQPLVVALVLGLGLAIATVEEHLFLLHLPAALLVFLPLALLGPLGWPYAAAVAGVGALWVIWQRTTGRQPEFFGTAGWWQLGMAVTAGGALWDSLPGATLALGVFVLVLMVARARSRTVVADTPMLSEVGSVLVVLSAAWSTLAIDYGPVHMPLVFGWILAVVVSLALAFGRRPAFGTYLTEASLGGLIAMLRYRTPVLEGLAGYEALFVAGAAILMVGFSQLLRRRANDQVHEAATAIQRTAALLPMLIPALIEWDGRFSEAFALLAGGFAHAALARSNRSMVFGWLAAGFAYAALFPAWVASGSDAWTWSPVIAAGGVTLLILTQVYRKKLGDEASVLRTLGSLTVLGAGAAETLQFHTPGPALVLAALAILTVLGGILLRLRAYVFLGMGFLAADILLNLTRWGIEDRAVAGILGVTTGVLLIALGAAVAKYKRRLVARYREVREWQW